MLVRLSLLPGISKVISQVAPGSLRVASLALHLDIGVGQVLS